MVYQAHALNILLKFALKLNHCLLFRNRSVDLLKKNVFVYRHNYSIPTYKPKLSSEVFQHKVLQISPLAIYESVFISKFYPNYAKNRGDKQ